MPSERRTERIQVMMTSTEVAAIDEVRFIERHESRAEAIRSLIQRGARMVPIEETTTGQSA